MELLLDICKEHVYYVHINKQVMGLGLEKH